MCWTADVHTRYVRYATRAMAEWWVKAWRGKQAWTRCGFFRRHETCDRQTHMLLLFLHPSMLRWDEMRWDEMRCMRATDRWRYIIEGLPPLASYLASSMEHMANFSLSLICSTNWSPFCIDDDGPASKRQIRPLWIAALHTVPPTSAFTWQTSSIVYHLTDGQLADRGKIQRVACTACCVLGIGHDCYTYGRIGGALLLRFWANLHRTILCCISSSEAPTLACLFAPIYMLRCTLQYINKSHTTPSLLCQTKSTRLKSTCVCVDGRLCLVVVSLICSCSFYLRSCKLQHNDVVTYKCSV
jgi:hypothetical protein